MITDTPCLLGGAVSARSPCEHPLKTSVSTCVTSAGSAASTPVFAPIAPVSEIPQEIETDSMLFVSVWSLQSGAWFCEPFGPNVFFCRVQKGASYSYVSSTLGGRRALTEARPHPQGRHPETGGGQGTDRWSEPECRYRFRYINSV